MQNKLSFYVKKDSYKKTLREEETNIQRNIIRHMLEAHPEGVTDLEICSLTGFSRTSVTARRNEIEGVQAVGFAKIIHESGDRLNTLWTIVNTC